MQMQATPGKRLRTAAAAEYLGLKPGTLEKYRIYGGGPLFEKLGRRIVVYTAAALDEWAARGRSTSTSDPSATALRPRSARTPRHPKAAAAVAP
ncbi:MAG: DNA-binding protein [Myxococcales bacterium]|nr:DNA-binding protein [Myxococcales bacterium]